MSKGIKLIQSKVFFDDLTHTYWLEGKQLKGITGTLIERAYPNSYDGVPESVMLHAAERGHRGHDAIENALMGKEYNHAFDDIVNEALAMFKQEGLNAIAVEYVVSDGQNYASPIDIVAEKDGDIYIVDIKFTYTLMRKHVTLQTNIYENFFARQNPHLKVAGRKCLWFHINDSLTIQDKGLFDLDKLPEGFIDDLIVADINDTPFDVNLYYGDLSKRVEDVQLYLKKLQDTIDEKKEEMGKIKAGLLALMTSHNLMSYKSDVLTLTRTLAHTSNKFDYEKFKEEHPKLYAKYVQPSLTKSSIRITFKKEKK